MYWADVGLLVVCQSRLSCLHTHSFSFSRVNGNIDYQTFLQEGNSLGKLHGLLASPDQLQGILDAVSKKRTNNKSNKQTNLLFSMKGQLEDEEVDECAPFLGQVKTGGYVKAGGYM